jgi:hypothetical protein
MPPSNVKVVTIVTDITARERLLNAFNRFGVHGFTAFHAEGMGAHGEKQSGLTGTKNIVYVVVASESIASRLLRWVDEELLPTFPSIAYGTDAVAVTGTPIK